MTEESILNIWMKRQIGQLEIFSKNIIIIIIITREQKWNELNKKLFQSNSSLASEQ